MSLPSFLGLRERVIISQTQNRNTQTHVGAICHSRTARSREVDVVVGCRLGRPLTSSRRKHQKRLEVTVSLVSIIQRVELTSQLRKQARGLRTLASTTTGLVFCNDGAANSTEA